VTTYSLLGQAGTPDHLDTYTGSLVNGLAFAISEGLTLTGIWFYSDAGAGQLPSEVGLFNSLTDLVFSDPAPSWSGAEGSGWVKYSCSHALSAGTYTAAAWNGAGGGQEWYSITNAGWGPVTSGPLSCTSDPNVFDTSGTFEFPASAYGANQLWLDVEVSDGASPPSGTGVAAVALSASGTGSSVRSGSGPAAVALSAAGSGASARAGSGVTAVSLLALAAGVPHKAGTGTALISLSALATAPPAVAQQSGSWWGLDTILRENRQEFDSYWSRPPLDCPVCGQPLVNAPSTAAGSGVELYCDFAGDHQYHYPRDRDVPVRMDSGSAWGWS
jgi:hypothetical protein